MMQSFPQWQARRALRVQLLDALVFLALGVLIGWGMWGCATVRGLGTDTRQPGQDDAERIVWREGFGRTDEPPRVHWVVDARELNCTDPVSGDVGFRVVLIDRGWTCRGGVQELPWAIYIAKPEGRPISGTTYVHENAHVWLLREGQPDPLHVRDDVWGDMGLVERVNAALEGAGL